MTVWSAKLSLTACNKLDLFCAVQKRSILNTAFDSFFSNAKVAYLAWFMFQTAS